MHTQNSNKGPWMFASVIAVCLPSSCSILSDSGRREERLQEIDAVHTQKSNKRPSMFPSVIAVCLPSSFCISSDGGKREERLQEFDAVHTQKSNKRPSIVGWWKKRGPTARFCDIFKTVRPTDLAAMFTLKGLPPRTPHRERLVP